MKAHRAMPVLDVTDVVAAEAFWTGLGFVSQGTLDDPPSFCIVERDRVTLGLALKDAAGPVPLNNVWAAIVYVDDAEALHAALEAAGAAVGALRVNTPMGLDIFELTDPDGHRIAFARDTSADRTGPGLKG
jgi:predicted enzyme related to lactoylglutathione lyase